MTDSDTTMVTETDTANISQHYAEFHIDAIHKNLQYKSSQAFDKYSVGSTVYLEFDYQCNHPIFVGIVINSFQQSVEHVLIILNPRPDSFNHIYVDIGTTLMSNPDADNFNIVFGASLDEQEGYTSGYGRIDNIKLLHF